MDESKLNVQVELQATADIWLAVHGNLCLSLRHPRNTGPSRKMVEHMVYAIEQALLVAGVLDQTDIDEVHGVEFDSRRRRYRPSQN